MHSVARRVVRMISTRALYEPVDRVAIAISGGPDSVALAGILAEIAAQGGARVAGLVHVNHLLRGDESDEDERFCVALAARAGWPIDVARVDVRALARERRQSIEAAARHARYQVFDEAARRLDATVIATGHTLDDQAETVLLRLLRGAGTRGLSGIRPRRGNVVRPLIECRRAELRRYLEARGELYRVDSSNSNLDIPRNRIRHEILPRLEAIAPGCPRALARLASHAGDDERFLRRAAIELRPSIVLSSSDAAAQGVSPARQAVSAVRLGGLPPPLGRRLVREVAAGVAPGTALSAVHLDAVWALARADSTRGHLDLPGLAIDRDGDRLTFEPAEGRERPERGQRAQGLDATAAERPLTLPGSVTLPEAGVTISASATPRAVWEGTTPAAGDVAVLQATSVAAPLAIRYWRPGDRFRPLGAPGRRKLQDLFVDRKLPRARRHLVPIVVDAHGHILWVAGVAMAEECRVTASEAGVVILEMRKL